MNLSDINESQIKALAKAGMNLSHYWCLHTLYKANIKMLPWAIAIREMKLLIDRGLINSDGILRAGEVFYEKIRDTKLESPVTKKEKVVTENKFEAFWSEYPSSANFSIKGMNFTSSRALRSNKQVCKMLYDAAIAQGVATDDQIITATKYMVEKAKEESFDTGVNKLNYLPGIEPFLRQQRYLAFVDIAHEEEQPSDTYWGG